MGYLKRGGVSIFKQMGCFGAVFAEWVHPEKQLGVALARDNHCSLSRKIGSPPIIFKRRMVAWPFPAML